MLFQLYLLLNTNLEYVYPYVGISTATNKIIQIHNEQTNVLNAEDSTFCETDYLPTSRYVEFDLPLLDRLVENYTNQKEYRIITRFNEEKHITLTYHSPNNEAPKDYDIFIGYPSERAEKLVNDVYPLMESLKLEVLQMDE